ncbi:MAG: lipoyl synthase [Candidatus Omnitrophica bacterium]|nr:lipoyl synthase [Candidatus Omnitrophota bacterium]
MTNNTKEPKRPSWIRGKISWNENSEEVKNTLTGLDLHTVCEEAACPNKGECWGKKHVTFIILGDTCTRGCSFCNVSGGTPDAPDQDEPERIAEAVKSLGIKYAVITSVTRDDLKDKGMGQFIETVKQIRKHSPQTEVELLIPDFGADKELLKKIAFSGVEVVGHNIEMPEKFYLKVRPRSDYSRSLKTLEALNSFKKEAGILVKSAMMLGVGETEKDIFRTLSDLKKAGVDIIYMGQYLNPSKGHWPVKKYYTPEDFKIFKQKALDMGFEFAASAPLIRSSYVPISWG